LFRFSPPPPPGRNITVKSGAGIKESAIGTQDKLNMVVPSLDADECIETLKSGECVSEHSLKLLCSYVSELLMEESNVQPVLSPVTVRFTYYKFVFCILCSSIY
jgi:hypothetical protein